MTSVNMMNPLKKRAKCFSPRSRNSKNTVASASRTGISASNSTSKNARYSARLLSRLPGASLRSALLSLLLFSGLLLCPPASAQNTDLQAHINQALSALEQLDNLAGTCLIALDDAASATSQQACSSFMDAVDGNLLSQYLDDCKLLKAWRDEYIAQAINTIEDNSNNTELLRNLVGTDYACGADALQQRTQFVTTAFSRLQTTERPNSLSQSELNRRLAESKFDATLNEERRLLQNSVQLQQQRRQQETTRQMHQLENELIRQQIDRSNQ